MGGVIRLGRSVKSFPEGVKRGIVAQLHEGPGTELKTILQRFGIRPTSGCKCNKRAAIMDDRGNSWCEKNIPEIIGWLQEEAKRRRLPFNKTLGTLLVKKAIRNSRNRRKRAAAQPKEPLEEKEHTSTMKWAYGVITVPSRRKNLLPRTLASLKKAGFSKPRLFVEGSDEPKSWKEEFNLEITVRTTFLHSPKNNYGNWLLGLWELYLREPFCDRYAMFEDDFVTYRNLRQYLEQCEYPDKGYWNLCTFPSNQKLAPPNVEGWYLSNQLGKSAIALVFNRDAIVTLLTHQRMTFHGKNARKGFGSLDGVVVTAFKKDGWKEYVHNPSLVDHIGNNKSIMKHGRFPLSRSFRGESFDARDLVRAK